MPLTYIEHLYITHHVIWQHCPLLLQRGQTLHPECWHGCNIVYTRLGFSSPWALLNVHHSPERCISFNWNLIFVILKYFKATSNKTKPVDIKNRASILCAQNYMINYEIKYFSKSYYYKHETHYSCYLRSKTCFHHK